MDEITTVTRNDTDLSEYQNDPDLVPVVIRARDEYERISKVFPSLDKEAFFAVYLAGYVEGMQKGIEAVKSINTKLEK